MRGVELTQAINWNTIPDKLDKTINEKLTTQFWVPEKFAVSSDLAAWRTLTEDEQMITMRVFAGLTLLDTVQANVGVLRLFPDAVTDHEKAVLALILFMEHIHARSYSYVFQTLSQTSDINEAFRWTRENEQLQYKSKRIQDIYNGDDPLKRKIASVFLESFLFYSGFYWPLYLHGKAKLTNTAQMISFIIRDEAIHGYYIGYKFQLAFSKLKKEERAELQEWAEDLLIELYDNEVKYTQDLYDGVGRTEDVKKFLRYNANKALMILGFDSVFPKEDVNPQIISGLSLAGGNHDFFSGTGNYQIANTRLMTKEDMAAVRAML